VFFTLQRFRQVSEAASVATEAHTSASDTTGTVE
jgi:hypothetical protein